MLEILSGLHPVFLALLAGIFTWLLTSIGASAVFFGKTVTKKNLDLMLGSAAGIMVAASFFSMLLPSIALSRPMIPYAIWFPPVAGFLLGGFFFRLMDMYVPHLHARLRASESEGIKTNWKQTILLSLAVTIHNVPEGLAIGIAFGAAALSPEQFLPAVTLALGIGIQDIPEGLAISLPLRRAGLSKMKSFWYGSLSAIVEPVAALIGALAVVLARPILPYALAFGAGAMMFVVVEELIPESQSSEHGDIATIGFMIGFAVMMLLEVLFTG